MTIDTQQLLKRKYYYQGFNGTPGLLIFGAPSSCKYMWKHLGYGYTCLIDWYLNDKCYYGYAWDDLHSIRDELLSRVKKDIGYLNELQEKENTVVTAHFGVLKRLDGLDLSKLHELDLLREYQILAESFNELLGVSHIVEGFTLTCEDEIRKKLREEVGDARFNDVLTVITQPSFSSFVGEVHHRLQTIALFIKREIGSSSQVFGSLPEEIQKQVKQLVNDFHWSQNSYARSVYLDEHYFVGEINDLLKKEINEEEVECYYDFIEQTKCNKKDIKQTLSKELTLLLDVSDFMAEFQDNRKKHISITISYVDRFLQEIAKRYSLTHENVRYLLQAEITDGHLRNVTDEDLEKRKRCALYFYTKESQEEKNPLDRFMVVVGNKANDMIQTLTGDEGFDATELKGNCASSGSVRGVVKVCRGADQIGKMEKGDILVACMTQPEFVPAMKKAAAIVTDEGGLTCHAAIISRELGIPCVIGTRHATKVLKDGMEVEVDADSGVVKIFQ